jgi:MFS family permease
MRWFGGPLWRNAEFLKLWIGSSVSMVGSQITVLALPLTAVLVFSAGPAETGLLAAASVAPMLLFNLPVGALVDRLPKRRVRIVSAIANAAVVASAPVAALFHLLTLEQLYVVAFLGGTCTVWSRLGNSTLLPRLAGRENLVEANTMMLTSASVALVAGPSLGGVLVQLLSAPLALLFDATTYLVSAFFTWRIKLEEPPPAHTSRSIWHDVGHGLVWLRGEPVLFRLTVCIGLANLAWYGVQAVTVVYATRDLGLSPAMLGLVLGIMGPASLLGAVTASRIARRFGLGPTMVAALGGEALSRILLVVAGGPPLVAATTIAASQIVFGFIAPLWDVNANSLRQSATPEHLLGRVSAASTFIGVGMAPIGAVLAGWIGEVASPRAALLETTLVTLLAVAILVRSPVPCLRDPASALRIDKLARDGQEPLHVGEV